VRVVGAAFVTILMIVGNTMVMAVRERTREIGVLKTLGFSGGRVLRLVLGETLLLALIGGLPGIAVAALVTLSMRESLANFVPGLTLDPWVIAIAFVVSGSRPASCRLSTHSASRSPTPWGGAEPCAPFSCKSPRSRAAFRYMQQGVKSLLALTCRNACFRFPRSHTSSIIRSVLAGRSGSLTAESVSMFSRPG
jgi:hypothetical protein